MTSSFSQRLPRRAFLGGAAAVIGLPLLASMLPRRLGAQAESSPRRLLYYYVPNGIHMPAFVPTGIGADYELPPILAPLAEHRGDFSVISGLENAPANPNGAGDHAAGTAAFITCASANKSETDIRLGISADQIAAREVGQSTRLPSWQLGISGGSNDGNCDSGYSCAYSRNISWSGPKSPLPKQVNPAAAFDALFEGFDPGASDRERAKRRLYQKSVLDAASQEAAALRVKLGQTDAAKLDQYLTGVRELERRIDLDVALSCNPGERPPERYDYPTQVGLMNELMVLAMQCDATRVISFMLGNAGSNATHPFLGITERHHELSHHLGDPRRHELLVRIGTWEVVQLASLLALMKSVPDSVDGSQSLLDNTTLFWSSEISDGNRHNHDDMPVLLAGHGGGALSPGRHIAFSRDQGERVSNLLVSTLSTVGVDAAVGDSTHALQGV